MTTLGPNQHDIDVRKILRTLLVAQGLGSAAITSLATIATIVGAELSGGASLAGLTASSFQLGTAFGSIFWSLSSDRLGWRGALSSAVFVGALGAFGAVAGVIVQNFWFLLFSLFIAASAQAAFNLGRFTAAEVSQSEKRGRAVALIVLGGTVGSVVGPQLISVSGQLAKNAGLSEWVGPYAVTALLFTLTGIVLATFLKPEPKRLAKHVAQSQPNPMTSTRSLSTLFQQPQVFAAIATMVISHGVMVMLMQLTSLHMRTDHHPIGHISAVFSSHTFGMFAFSIFSGQLVDRWGKRPMLILGSIILLAACLSAPLSPHVFPIAVALFLLGLGWNFCFVAGSAMLSSALSPSEKSKTQGFNDLLIGLTAATSSYAGGPLFAHYGYTAIGLISAGFCVALMLLVVWYSTMVREKELGFGD
ncbi:MAG: MFS transporter [Trueperaceae bacterium]